MPTSIVGVTVNVVLLPLQNIFIRFVASTLVFFVFQYSLSILILRKLLICLKFDSKNFTHIKLTIFMYTISWTPLPLVKLINAGTKFVNTLMVLKVWCKVEELVSLISKILSISDFLDF